MGSTVHSLPYHATNTSAEPCSPNQNLKTTPTTTIDDYIAQFPPDVQKLLQKIRATIRAAAPAAQETIKYQIPTFTLHGNLLHFAAFKTHIGFYPTPSAIKAFAKDLTNYQTAKGSIQFPLTSPIPYPLIKRIVQFRVKEASQRT